MSMKTLFGFDHLSREEGRAIEQLLVKEMEEQQWVSITYSIILSGELNLSPQ